MIITLTTDFGLADGYAAAMKGVILSRAPRATVVDLSHEIAPFDVHHAAFVLRQAAPYFPPGVVHVCVVDPGVGGPRRGLAIAAQRQLFVGPDNGVFTPFLNEAARVFELTNPDLWLPQAGATFHGRDLFAPTAVHLAQGLPPADCGPPVTDAVRLPAWEVRREGDAFVAAVVHVDRFGNAITGLTSERLAELGADSLRAQLPTGEVVPLRRAYADVLPGEPLTLVGSSGLLEIAVREGSAAQRFGLTRGAPIRFAR
jgi:hypothetical protein